jgi:hypothetical protein
MTPSSSRFGNNALRPGRSATTPHAQDADRRYYGTFDLFQSIILVFLQLKQGCLIGLLTTMQSLMCAGSRYLQFLSMQSSINKWNL